jgi:zinc and cadmium transporter
MFLLQRFFHFHHHDVPDEDPEGCAGHAHSHEEPDRTAAEAPGGPHLHAGAPVEPHTSHEHAHGEDVHHDHTLAGKSARHLSWAGAAFGLTLHSLIDGVALAASVEAASHGAPAVLLGFGTFLVILLHNPFDAMVISTLMTAGGWSRAARHLVNALFALAIPAGIVLFHFGATRAHFSPEIFLGAALAFAAGTFLCISASDLLPELQFHSHDRGKLSFALLLGLLLAIVIGRFETTGHDSFVEPGNGVEGVEPAAHEHEHSAPADH